MKREDARDRLNACHLGCFFAYRPGKLEIEVGICSSHLKWKNKMYSVGCVHCNAVLLHLVYLVLSVPGE